MRVKILSKIIAILFITGFINNTSLSQGIAMNTNGTPPNPSAMLDVSADNKGILIPKIALKNATDIETINLPANSLLVYNTNDDKLNFPLGEGYYYNEGNEKEAHWVKLIDNTDKTAWSLKGNAGINEALNFIGTTDDRNVIIKREGTRVIEIKKGGAILMTGNITSGETPASGAGSRVMWVPNKTAFRAGGITSSQWDAENIGTGSFATGIDNTALGKSSFAAGENNIAKGNYTTALGNNAQANGNYSTALGNFAIADGIYSIAMGVNSKAESLVSVAIGFNNIAKANFSTAIGANTQATDIYAIALGNNTVASGESALATGSQTTASAKGAASLGIGTMASGTGAVAAGNLTIALGESSVAFGTETTARGKASSALGNKTIAAGDYSTATGSSTTANGVYSTSMGSLTIAQGAYSVAMGLASQADKNASVAMGFGTKAIGEASLSMGLGAVAKGNYAASLGFQTRANAYGSLSIGVFNDNSDENINGGILGKYTRLFQIGNGSSEDDRKNVMTVLNDGSIGIHTVSPSAPLDIFHSTDPNNVNEWSTHIKLDEGLTKSSAYIRYHPILNGLDFKVNTNTGGFSFYNEDVDDKDILLAQIKSNGNLIVKGCISATNVICPSDIRLKENIEPLKNILKKIDNIQPIGYNFKDKKTYLASRQIGFSAQDIERVFPELVNKTETGILAVNYAQMSAVAIQAIKEQQQQIEELKAQKNQQLLFNQQLLQQNEALIKRLEKLEQGKL